MSTKTSANGPADGDGANQAREGVATQQKLAVSSIIHASPDKVWSLAGDWSWWAFGPVQIDPAVPQVRRLANGAIVETLVARDQTARTVEWMK